MPVEGSYLNLQAMVSLLGKSKEGADLVGGGKG